MLAEDRRTRILEQVYAHGSVRTSALVESLDVSEVTIRNDLQELERQGRLVRIRGGATTLGVELGKTTFDTRLMRNKSAKERIALQASSMVRGDQTIVLDAGTTVLALAQRLPPVSGLTVVTPALTTAQQLLGVKGVDVVMIGGPVDPDTASVTWPSTTWPAAQAAGTTLIVHLAFMGAHGIDPDLDIVDVTTSSAALKQRLIEAGRRVILLADSSKWGVKGPVKVAPLSAVDVVITDDGVPPHVVEDIRRAGVELVIVDDTSTR